MTANGIIGKTALYSRHRNLGARMAPFGGYWMPMQYAGILAEHAAARKGASVFDTCHMGELLVSGKSACESLERILTCDLASMPAGKCRYGLMCNTKGGVIDDLVVYRLDEEEFMLVVNAGTRDGDYEWISSHVSKNVSVRNISEETAKVDVQGPGAPGILNALVDESIEGMKYYGFRKNGFMGRPILISRTGYTGEIGFEIYADPDTIALFWDGCMEKGAVASGLGARNTLRLEIGLPLYGHEWSRERNAADAGFERFISKTKTFIGCESVRDGRARRESLAGIAFKSRQAARDGNDIFSEEGNTIGKVTSGSFAPSLGYAVALGYVSLNYAAPGTGVAAHGRRILPGKIVRLPFYSKGTARENLAAFL